jgi:hypothetical protein
LSYKDPAAGIVVPFHRPPPPVLSVLRIVERSLATLREQLNSGVTALASSYFVRQ